MNTMRLSTAAVLACLPMAAAAAQPDYRAQAFAAVAADDLQKAADLFMKLFKAGADDQETLTTGSHCLEKSGRFNDALDVLSRGKEKFPGEVSFRVGLARVFNLKAATLRASLGKMDTHVVFNFQDSIREAQQLLKQWPDNRDGRLILANCQYTLGEWDKAKKNADDLVARFPTHPGGHIILGDLAFEHYKLLRRRAAGEDPEAARKTLAKMHGARKAARQGYEKAIGFDGKRVAAHRKLGDVHAWNGDIDDALAKYADALLLDPDTPVSHSWITEQTKPKARFAFYEKLGTDYMAKPGADKHKGARFVWFAAAAQSADKKYEISEQLYAYSVELNPDFASGYYYAMYSAWFYRDNADAALNYGALYAASAPIQFADLVRTLAGKQREGVTELVKFLAKSAMDKGNHAASRDLNHVLAAIVDTADAWNNYAFMARESGEYDRSEKAYRNALIIEPDSGQLMNDLGVILQYHKGSPDALKEADQLYRDAIRHAKNVLADGKAPKSKTDVARQTLSDANGNLLKLRLDRAKARRKGGK